MENTTSSIQIFKNSQLQIISTITADYTLKQKMSCSISSAVIKANLCIDVHSYKENAERILRSSMTFTRLFL